MRRVERKWHERTCAAVELVFIKHLESIHREVGAVRDAKLFEICRVVAEEPAADVHRRGGRVVEFDGVFERRIGVAEHFVDQRVG